MVCSRCRGKGTHVNPNIDGNGLPDECVNDPEFMESYMSGVYDVRCSECDGNKVLDVVDVDALSDDDKEAYHRHIDEIRSMEAEAVEERRLGC